jgi:hypothetical protein
LDAPECHERSLMRSCRMPRRRGLMCSKRVAAMSGSIMTTT